MDRREALAAATVAVSPLASGCLGLRDLLGGRAGERTVSLTDVAEVDAAHPFQIDVTLRSRAMAADATPELAVTLELTGEETRFLGSLGSWPAGGLLPARDSEPGGLRLLAEPEASDLTVERGECPTTEYRPTSDKESTGHRVSPGTRYRERYAVLGSAQALDADCPPAGRYRVRSRYEHASAAEVERDGWENASRTQFTWGFTLHVSDPD